MQETWIGKIPWRSEQLSTPVFESGGFFGLYSPWGLKESVMTEQLSLHYEDELWEILGKSVSGRGIANAKVLSWKVAINTRNMKKVREEERSNVLINWLSKKKKKKKAVIFSVCQFLIPWLSSSYHHDVGECDLGMRCPQLVLMSLFLLPQNHRLIVLNRFIEMCSTKLVIREMKIRTTMKDRLTPFSVAIIKKWKLADVDEYVEKKALLRQWHPTPVLMPGKSHGWRSLVGCSPWGR